MDSLSSTQGVYSDHEALKYINVPHKLHSRHVKWVEFLQAYIFHMWHKSGEQNQVADALCRKYALIFTMQVKTLEVLKKN